MKSSLFRSICVFSLFLPFSLGAEEIPTVVQTFEEYEANTKNYCDTPDREWSGNNSIVSIPQYPRLETRAVNAQIERTQSLDSLSEEERARLQKELNSNRIGNFSGYKTLEVARLQYRSAMDTLFACAVVESRLNILIKLQETLQTRIPSRNSEIQQKFQKEAQKLQGARDSLKCNSAGSAELSIMKELVNSSTRQYCHYRYYLGYLDSSLRADKGALERIERGIGSGSGTQSPATASQWVASYSEHLGGLEREIRRADSTLPRALRAFREMEQAYPIHLMLTIIYDDYIRLRKNLATYMNASSQLYLKAYNAQDQNKR